MFVDIHVHMVGRPVDELGRPDSPQTGLLMRMALRRYGLSAADLKDDAVSGALRIRLLGWIRDSGLDRPWRIMRAMGMPDEVYLRAERLLRMPVDSRAPARQASAESWS
jgi:hypothetical protein